MHKLISFDSTHLKNFAIFSELIFYSDNSNYMTLIFDVQDNDHEVNFETRQLKYEKNILERREELWKSTCFEMFLNPTGQKQYFEFNFSLEGLWNCYHFAGYRFPQPPQPSIGFQVEKMLWLPKRLEIHLSNHSSFKTFNVGLAAVIKNKNNQTTYFALKHESGKPDFHVNTTFTLQRG